MMSHDYTADELAGICRVNPSTVRRRIGQGKILAIRLPGGTFRIPEAEVRRLREPVVMGNNRDR